MKRRFLRFLIFSLSILMAGMILGRKPGPGRQWPNAWYYGGAL